jgi:hypothetical protein
VLLPRHVHSSFQIPCTADFPKAQEPALIPYVGVARSDLSGDFQGELPGQEGVSGKDTPR